MHSEDDTLCHKLQVHTAAQIVHHQGNQSVFVGGRLWSLLPSDAFLQKPLVFPHTHTHTLFRGNLRLRSVKVPVETAHVAQAVTRCGTWAEA